MSVLCLCLGVATLGWGIPIDLMAPPPAKVGDGETVQLDIGLGPTGILFRNESGTVGEVAIDFIDGPHSPKDAVVPGFVLLDGTLRVGSTVPDGQKRVRIRVGYSGRRLRRAGLREGSVRLMRRVRTTGRAVRWQPAIRAILGRATLRRFNDSTPVAGLGHYGFDSDQEFVWAFLDVTSDYAVGARAVAEPTSALFVVSGLGLLWWGRRRS